MLVVYLIICRVLYIPGGDRRISEPSTALIEAAISLVNGSSSPFLGQCGWHPFRPGVPGG